MGMLRSFGAAVRERAVEINGDRRREQEGAEIVADIESPRNFGKASHAQAGSLWPAGIRRPSRGGRWR